MCWKESKCPFCGADTSSYLPLHGYFPCPKCVDEKYDKNYRVKPEFADVLKNIPRWESGVA